MATEASAMASTPAEQRKWLGGIRSKPADSQAPSLPQARMHKVSAEVAGRVLERLFRYTTTPR